jgi:proline iminopeptidase
MRDSTVTTPDGVRLFVRRIGQGPALLVPNGIAYLDDFAPLAEHHQVVAFDLRNRGASAAVPTARGLPDDVVDLETVRTALGLGRCATLGHSYVAVIVARHAMLHPEAVTRVVMIGAPPPDPATQYPPELAYADEVTARVFTTLPQLYQQGLSPDELFTRAWDTLRPLYVADPANASKIRWERGDCPNERAFLPYFMTVVQPSLAALKLGPDDFAAVTAAVLVVHGRKDRSAPFGAACDWVAALPNARLLEVPDAAHAPWLEDASVLPAIQQFLAE